MANENGILNGTIKVFSLVSSRWLMLLLTFSVLSSSNIYLALGIFHVSMFFLVTLASLILLQRILEKRIVNTFWKNNLITQINLALLLVNTIFFATIKIDETWWWLSSTSNYLVNGCLMIILLSLILKNNGALITKIIVAGLAFIIGSNNEALALIILLSTPLILLADKTKRIILLKETKVTLILVFFFALSGFLVLMLGEGTQQRISVFGSIGIFQSLMLNIKMTGIIILKRIPLVILPAFIFSLVWFFLFVPEKTIEPQKAVRNISAAGLILGIATYLYQWPITYITHDVAAFRALFPISLLLLSFCYYSLYQLRQAFLVSEKFMRIGMFITVLVLLCWNGFTLYQQAQILPNYTEAYQNRTNFITEHSDSKDTLCLPPLPSSGLIYSAEISNKPDYFTNQHLKNAFYMKGEIIVCK